MKEGSGESRRDLSKGRKAEGGKRGMRKGKNHNQENLDYNDRAALISYQDSPTRFSEHWHMSAEFILAMKDHSCYSVGKDIYQLNTGDVLLIWPTELHSVIDTPEKASLILQFDDTIIAGNNDLSLSLPVIQSIHLISARDEPELNRRVAALMLDSLRVFESKDFFQDTRIKINIYQILLTLCRHEMERSGSITDEGARSQMTLRVIRSACAYIARNCDRNLTQQEVADYAGFSYYHFSRLFKEYTSSSFSEYLARQRINRAVQQLGTTSVSITEIAYRAGFQSISSFNRVFRSYMHCSPREYRNNYRSPRAPRSETHSVPEMPEDRGGAPA